MKIHIIDYGMGNLGSVKMAVRHLGFEAKICKSPKALEKADKIILPGVGSFSEAMEELKKNAWVSSIREQVIEKRKPLLGICLGMQLLASYGEEGRKTFGLNLIKGKVTHLSNLGCTEKIPHVGWNDTHMKNKSKLFSNIGSGNDFFYIHSYAFEAENPVNISSVVFYEKEITASIENQNIFGTQFHPEKSSKVGLKLLRNFLEL